MLINSHTVTGNVHAGTIRTSGNVAHRADVARTLYLGKRQWEPALQPGFRSSSRMPCSDIMFRRGDLGEAIERCEPVADVPAVVWSWARLVVR